MAEISTLFKINKPDILDQSHLENGRVDDFFMRFGWDIKDIARLLENEKGLQEFLAQLATAVDNTIRELHYSAPFRRLVFTGSSRFLTQDILLARTSQLKKFPDVRKRLANPIFITGNQNKKIKHHFGITTLIPPLSIVIDDYAESMSKAISYIPEIFPGRSLFVLAIFAFKELGLSAKADIRRFSAEGRFKYGLADSHLAETIKLLSSVESTIVQIENEEEYWKSVQNVEYRWDKSKLTEKQLVTIQAAKVVMAKIREVITTYFQTADGLDTNA